MRYRLWMRASALSRSGYLAGDDDRRAREIERALADDEVEAIVCASGGYGVMRALLRAGGDALEPKVRRRPKWLVGFSDITALHVTLLRAGVASIHGPNATGLGRARPDERLALIDLLEGRSRRPWSGLDVRGNADARGVVVGGNLALLEAMAAANRLVVPEGAIVLLEDVTERPYRVDRMITSLLLGGHLARASAVVVGEFDQCDPGPDGVTVREVLEDHLQGLGVPIAYGAPFGHGARNAPFVIGRVASLDRQSGTLSFE